MKVEIEIDDKVYDDILEQFELESTKKEHETIEDYIHTLIELGVSDIWTQVKIGWLE